MTDEKQFFYPDTDYSQRFTADFADKIIVYLRTECGHVLLCAFMRLVMDEMETLFSREHNLSVGACYDQAFTRVSPIKLSRHLLKTCQDYGFATSNIDLIQTHQLALIFKFDNCRLAKRRIRAIFTRL